MAFTKATYDYLDSGGLINWQLTAKTAAFTAVSGEGYLVDTTSAAITVTLPAAPSAGDEIIIVDYASNAGTNNITLGRNSLNIRGATDDLVLDNDNQTARLLYSGATKGWLVTTEAGGGAAAAVSLTVDYLVVAGGGAGGGPFYGGGGGAGGYLTSFGDAAVSELTLNPSTDYIVTVGPGGTGGAGNDTPGSDGFNSTFDTITSTGGGGGGGGSAIPGNNNGRTGGSGGGASYGTAGAGTPGQGNNGGGLYGGGGGGAGAVGSSGGTTAPYFAGGGVGLSNSITGTSEFYAGGGGGGSDSQTSILAPGGAGGGGGGGIRPNTNATAGSPNTGGGGGGAGGLEYGNTGKSGGSGVVILRYSSNYTISETTAGGNVLSFSTDDITVPGTKITTFTAGANGTIQFST